ncbi:unnamed protein product [Cylicostephanus goldi]|uniref:Uncharacterized protein n=1 Tax=Cylicostephanus goldi TaxID=71465 RepID=A0A3P6QXI5_CYLGO|nr:unnamed protein product [Cylicostephanus goldi]
MGRGAAIRNRKLRRGSSDSEPIASRMRIPNKKQRKIMDELLLNSNLKRADDATNGIIRPVQPILREKPTTPFIVLPEEARFAPLIKKSRYALDIGGTLVKLVYSTVCERADKSGCEEPEVLLNFKKFTSIEACLDFINNVSSSSNIFVFFFSHFRMAKYQYTFGLFCLHIEDYKL